MTKAEHFELGFLELGDTVTGSTTRGFRDVIAYAKQIESSGFKRLWLAEHQASGDCWGSPEVPLALLAQQTTKLNIGTAGVLIKYHNPLQVASNFCFLEHNFSQRIDLGIARGIPTAPGNAALLASADGEAAFERNVRLLVGLLNDDHATIPSDTVVLPQPPRSPRLWMLGSGSGASQTLANELGLRYIHAFFFRSSRAPADGLPIHAIAVAGFCTDDEALCESFIQNYDGPFNPMAIGNADKVYATLSELAIRFSVRELVFLDLAPSFDQKLRSVCSLAETVDKRLALIAATQS